MHDPKNAFSSKGYILGLAGQVECVPIHLMTKINFSLSLGKAHLTLPGLPNPCCSFWVVAKPINMTLMEPHLPYLKTDQSPGLLPVSSLVNIIHLKIVIALRCYLVPCSGRDPIWIYTQSHSCCCNCKATRGSYWFPSLTKAIAGLVLLWHKHSIRALLLTVLSSSVKGLYGWLTVKGL